MRKYFKGVTEKEADGWMLSFITGRSSEDNQDYVVDTNSLHADQVPDACNDAKSFSRLVAGLLNYYYNGFFEGVDDDMLMELGTVTKAEEIPSAKNPELPF